MDWSDYQVEGQISITDYFASKIKHKEVMDFTSFLNSQGKSQYQQIGEIIRSTYEREKDNPNMIDRITNAVSVYVLNQSMDYSKYLIEQSKLDQQKETNMEVTVITTVQITEVYKDVPECFVEDKDAIKATTEDVIKERMNVDDVVVTNVQEFRIGEQRYAD